jgi:hypothetical protein
VLAGLQVAGLDAPTKVLLLLCGQQGDLVDLLEIGLQAALG